MRELSEIVADIGSYTPGSDWLGLDELMEELFSSHPIELQVRP